MTALAEFAIYNDDLQIVEQSGNDVEAVERLLAKWGNLDCLAMAAALEDMTGWPILALNEKTIMLMPPIHVCMQTPDGFLMDVYGVFLDKPGRIEMQRRYDIHDPVWRSLEPWEMPSYRADHPDRIDEAVVALKNEPWLKTILERAGFQTKVRQH